MHESPGITQRTVAIVTQCERWMRVLKKDHETDESTGENGEKKTRKYSKVLSASLRKRRLARHMMKQITAKGRRRE